MWNWFKPIRSVDELIRRKKTVSGCLWWVECNIYYRTIGSTYPTPEAVLKERKANCKGFSVLSAAILRRFGYYPYLVGYAWEGKDGKDIHHSIVVYQDSSVWRYVSLGISNRVDPTPTSLVDAVRKICPDCFYAQEIGLDGSHLQTLITGAK